MDLPNSRDFAAHSSADSATARSRAKSYSGSRPNPLSPASRLSQSSLGGRPAISRLHRSNTIVHYQDLHSDALQHNPSAVWDPERPGAEPGIDPSKADAADLKYANLVARSQITLVDFAADRDRYAVHEMWNEEFLDFMKLPRPEWATCRWINVNGLSWDVISSLGKRYKLHRLAIEDLVHGRGRAKVDWYPNSVYSKSIAAFSYSK
jgi:Mg2+ and Co2+ transporter CorA